MIIHGDCLEEMRKMEPNSISAIVTDPPYGLGFMGKDWDKAIATVPYWEECLRICKPGGFLLAFGSPRMHHRLACMIEDPGWEIRDCLMWIYGSGFPKSHNHFGMEGYGTALKPAYEPIIMAMKPCEGTFKQNAEKWAQAGINIDGCRIETDEKLSIGSGNVGYQGGYVNYDPPEQHSKGRWPANVIFDEEAGKMLDEQSGYSKSSDSINHQTKISGSVYGWSESQKYLRCGGHNDSGGASRFFYCAKAAPSERGEDNRHPTVKPLKLMEYLIKLIMPPKDGVLLDPFAGSGTTMLAALKLGYTAIGIEKEQEYCEIARKRLESIESLAKVS